MSQKIQQIKKGGKGMNQYIFWLIILWLVDIAGILIMHKLEEDAWWYPLYTTVILGAFAIFDLCHVCSLYGIG